MDFRQPTKYWDLKLPSKLPPKREPISISGLPMLGYMEQTCSLAIVKAVTAVGNLKPKFPFMTARESALLFIAFHLKGMLLAQVLQSNYFCNPYLHYLVH